MKRILSILAVLFIVISAENYAKNQNEVIGNLLKFKMEITETNGNGGENSDDEEQGNENGPKSTPTQPSIGHATYTLYIYNGCDNTTLRLIDESDNVAFTQYIPTGTTQVVLPSTLSGTYELQIIRGQYLFYTEIGL